jgi:MFS family permease
MDATERRWTLLAAALTRFVDAVGLGVLLPLCPLLAIRYGASAPMAMALTAMYPLVGVALNPLLGRLSDRYGRRSITLGGIAVNLVGYLLFARAGSLAGLFLARLVSGIGGSNVGATGAIFSDLSTLEERPRMMALRASSHALGVLVGPLVGAAFVAVDVMLPVHAVSALLLLNLAFAWRHLRESVGVATTVPGPPARRGGLADLEALHGAAGLVTLAFAVIYSVLPLVVSKVFVVRDDSSLLGPLRHLSRGAFNDSVYLTAALTCLCLLSAIAAQVLVSARLIGAVGERSTLLCFTGVWAVAFVTAPVTLHAGLIPHLATVLVTGFAYGVLYPAFSTYVSRRSPAAVQGHALGSLDSTINLAMTLGPLAAGPLFALALPMPYVGAALLACGSLPLLVRLRPHAATVQALDAARPLAVVSH